MAEQIATEALEAAARAEVLAAADYITRLIAEWPPLSVQQRALLAEILLPARRSGQIDRSLP